MISGSQSFLVCGAGSWGSAIALHLHRKNHKVRLWGRHPHRISEYLPNIAFPEDIHFYDNLETAFKASPENTIVVLAVPSHAFEQTLVSLNPYLNSTAKILWVTKGLSTEGLWLHDLVRQHFPESIYACLSGPSFAMEVAKALPTAVTIASPFHDFANDLLEAIHSEKFRIYLTDDVLGVELGGVVKNVLAIAVGMSDGLGFGANARSALVTRGIAEMCRLGTHLGAKLSTLMGLSGLGDCVLTCTDNQSRNRRFGLALGKSSTVEGALKSIGQVVEGQVNAAQLIALAAKNKIEMPICQQVYEVLYNHLSPMDAVNNLLTRPPKEEALF